LGAGTCFFWSHAQRMYLVTNAHNVTGKNPFTGKLLDPRGAVLDRLTFDYLRVTTEPDAEGFVEYQPAQATFLIYDEFPHSPKWFIHPIHGASVDIAVFDITPFALDLGLSAANEIEHDAIADLKPAHGVFIVGYPFGRLTGSPTPIWKRGTIAVDPTYDIDGVPKILVDTATRSGMSGSIVIARTMLLNGKYRRKSGGESEHVLYALFDTVIGIYSGRIYPDLEKAQLGIVWKRDAIEATVEARQSPV
jgi:hypothetical protein